MRCKSCGRVQGLTGWKLYLAIGSLVFFTWLIGLSNCTFGGL